MEEMAVRSSGPVLAAVLATGFAASAYLLWQRRSPKDEVRHLFGVMTLLTRHHDPALYLDIACEDSCTVC